MTRGSTLVQLVSTVLFGEPVDRAALPDRVRQAISNQQAQSEMIISWLQLALVLFFILLYAIAPKTSAGTAFTPVPYVLSAYLFFTLTRLSLAQRRMLSRWFLIGSAIVDIALLFGLIWSFHLQYRQPPAFYLKAPTLLYVFLFIALRTLRFQPGYVIVTGLAAAVGWLVLVWYAIDPWADEPGIVTRDYVRYLTSNVVLIGGEVDKIVTILLVTVVLSVSIVRAGRLLIHSVVDAMAARDLTRFVAPEVANRIVSSQHPIEPGDSEEKVATVMFCDIEGFSSIAERLPPDVLMHTLNAYFEAIQVIVDDCGGVITQFQGDAMLVTFNTVRPDEYHAANALRAAAAIQELVARERFGPDLRLPTRCGINTGKMITGAVGSRERLYFTVYGDEVNVAARLEQLNKQLGTYVLAAAACCEAAGTVLPMRPIGEVSVRGRDAPVSIYTLDRA
jgi:adenylate cyclase